MTRQHRAATVGTRSAAWTLMLALGPAAVGGAAATAEPAPWLVFDAHRVCAVGPAPGAEPACTDVGGGLRGAPVPQGDGRHAWVVGGDGALVQVDLDRSRVGRRHRLPATADAAAGTPATALAASADGRFVMLAAAGRLAMLDAAGSVLADWALPAGDGAAVVALAALPARRSFLVVPAGLDEAWEISHDPAAPPIFDGLVHDYRLGEAIGRPGYLGRRRIPLPGTLRAAFVDPGLPWFWALPAAPGAGLQIVHLDVRRVIARFDIAAHGAPARRRHGDRDEWVVAGDAAWHIIDPARWRLAGTQAIALDRTVTPPVQADRAGARLWAAQRDAAGRLQLVRWADSGADPAARWDAGDTTVVGWAPSDDGGQLLVAWCGGDRNGTGPQGGLWWLDGRTLAPLQHLDGPCWRGLRALQPG